MVIRPAEADDSARILELVTAILSKEFPGDQAAYATDDLKNLLATYGGPGNSFFVAEENHKVIGTCGVKAENKQTAILRRFFVDARYRDRGIGSGLLKEALAFCRTSGFREVVIRTSTRMEKAIRLCKQLGFREDGNWTLGNVTLVRFRLRLT